MTDAELDRLADRLFPKIVDRIMELSAEDDPDSDELGPEDVPKIAKYAREHGITDSMRAVASYKADKSRGLIR